MDNQELSNISDDFITQEDGFILDEVTNTAKDRKPMLDSLNRAYATGKRKTSVARVWVKEGTGKITVNNIKVTQYFKNAVHNMIIQQPFEIVDIVGKFDIVCTVHGGGVSGQAQAVRHGITLALVNYNPEAYYRELRKAGLVTRDARVVERKKYGHKKARKSFQFSKR